MIWLFSENYDLAKDIVLRFWIKQAQTLGDMLRGQGMLQRQFSWRDMPFFLHKTVLLWPQNVAQNSACLNSFVMGQGLNDLNFQRHIVITALSKCYASVHFV